MAPGVTSHRFGTFPDGRAVDCFVIANGNLELRALTYGGIVSSLRVPDRDGRMGDVVLGHQSLEEYLPNRPYLGAIVGRCANRLDHGRFDLDGHAYRLATNDGAHHLHGGTRGFDQQVWAATEIRDPEGIGVRFTRTSPAGEEHYPGALHVAASYLLTEDDTVVIRFDATCDEATIVNLTQHSYFNLAGESSSSVLDHRLTIHADAYTPVQDGLIPTGEIVPVEETPFDFRKPAAIGERLQLDHQQLRRGLGFDHNFVLAANSGAVSPAAELFDPSTGRLLRIATSEPGLQFYGGQLLDGRSSDAYGRVLRPHAGLCLETQHFPDAPNQPAFPSITLRPGHIASSTTIWQFSADSST